MKLFGAVVGFLIVSVAAVLILPRLRPSPPPPHDKAGSHNAPQTQGGGYIPPPRPADPVRLPDPEERRLREEATRKRLPFFQFLRAKHGGDISSFGVTESVDTLDIVVTNPDPQAIQNLVALAISPTAEQYGFRKVRVYIPNPPGTIEPLSLVAESTYDGAGRWNTFLK